MQNPDILLKIEAEIKEKAGLKKRETDSGKNSVKNEKPSIDRNLIAKELGKKESPKKEKASARKIISDIMGEVELGEE